jgi:hypothetical protein
MNLSCGVYNTPAAGVGEKYYEIYFMVLFWNLGVTRRARENAMKLYVS